MATKQATQKEATDESTDPEITRHVEPPEQGGEHYIRAECCGAEVIGTDESRMRHRDDCPSRMGIKRGSVLRNIESGTEYVVIDVNADSVYAYGVERRVEYEFPTCWMQANCEVA